MNNGRETLEDLMLQLQLAEVRSRSFLKKAMAPALSELLRLQLRELSALKMETRAIACQRGWEIPEASPALRFLEDRRMRRKLSRRDSSAGILRLLILEYTDRRISLLALLNRYPQTDDIRILLQKAADSPRAAIGQLEAFL